MFVRLILVLLLSAFAVPAGAAPMARAAGGSCHEAPPAPAHHERRDEAVVAHVCIGCVPVADWLRGAPAAIALPAAPAPVARVATLDIGTGLPPALPPPRGV